MDFNTFWELMGAEETFPHHKQAARIEWDKHPEKQEAIIQWLKQHGRYKKRKPNFFIQDFKLKATKSAPEFLRGDEPGDLVQVRYGNYYKICYREDALHFGLKITKDPWNKKPR